MESSTVLDNINKLILEESGVPIGIDDKLINAKLDSLSSVVFLLTLDGEYSIFPEDMPEEERFNMINMETTTIRELIALCKS